MPTCADIIRNGRKIAQITGMKIVAKAYYPFRPCTPDGYFWHMPENRTNQFRFTRQQFYWIACGLSGLAILLSALIETTNLLISLK